MDKTTRFHMDKNLPVLIDTHDSTTLMFLNKLFLENVGHW